MVEKSIMLAGTIEMGQSWDWQAEMISTIQDRASIIYNPRRPDFDATTAQSIDDAYFNGQVNCELDYLEDADLVAMYLDPNSKSVISMLELGFLAGFSPDKLRVCCPEGFWRRGNVQVVCNRYGIPLFDSFRVFKESIRCELERAYDIYKIKKVTP